MEKNMDRNSEASLIFQKFRLGLINWARTGKPPKSGNQDLQYDLELQKRRLKNHDLELRLELEPEGESMSLHETTGIPGILGQNDGKLMESTCAQYVNRRMCFTRRGMKLLDRKDYACMYETILDRIPGEGNVGGIPYVCPNCGAVSTVSQLQETGCPYCGTRYVMKDLYPKVAAYYFVSGAGMGEKQWTGYKKAVCLIAGVMALISTLLYGFSGEEMAGVLSLLVFPFSFACFAFITHLLLSVLMVCGVLGKAGASLSLIRNTAFTKKKMQAQLKELDPTFDYEYFEGKALSMAKTLLLSDHPEDDPRYAGKPLGSRFSDVVDIQYRGGIGLGDLKNSQDRIQVKIDVYLTLLIDRGSKLRQENRKVRLTMHHNAAFPVNRAFSMEKVQCMGCGGSFNARTRRSCPHCGRDYDPGLQDWIVTEMEG